MIDELIKKISSLSEFSEAEIKTKVIEKQTELSGLISDEGAAYIVAKELGVQLLREQQKLNIENIIPGMQNVDIIGRIVNISGVREFSTEKAKGKVMNLSLADTTGSVRLSLWNNEIDKIKIKNLTLLGLVPNDNTISEINISGKNLLNLSSDNQTYQIVKKLFSKVI